MTQIVAPLGRRTWSRSSQDHENDQVVIPSPPAWVERCAAPEFRCMRVPLLQIGIALTETSGIAALGRKIREDYLVRQAQLPM